MLYPVFLGFLICVLSLLSLKWGSNSGATWNLLALVGTFATLDSRRCGSTVSSAAARTSCSPRPTR